MALGLPGFGCVQLCGVLLCGHGAGAERGGDAASRPKLLPKCPGRAAGHGGPVALPVLGPCFSPSQLATMLWCLRAPSAGWPAMSVGLAAVGSGAAGPRHTVWGSPVPPPLRCWCAPVQGRPQRPVGQRSLSERCLPGATLLNEPQRGIPGGCVCLSAGCRRGKGGLQLRGTPGEGFPRRSGRWSRVSLPQAQRPGADPGDRASSGPWHNHSRGERCPRRCGAADSGHVSVPTLRPARS